MLKVVPLTDVAVWESEWINVLLAEFPEVKWLPYNAQVPMKDYALYVYNSDSALSLSPEILSGITKLKGAGLLHLGDEYLRSSLLDYAHFSYVVRMYSFSKTVTPGVLTIPIGPTPKLGPASSKPASRRKHTWMFAGDWKSDRSAMADQFTTWDKGLFSMPMPYNDAERLSRQDYLTGMSETAFAPCPAGNIVLETCRPYEALHFGAIPLLPRWLSIPVRSIARDGAQNGVARCWRKSAPRAASSSMFGVCASPPNTPKSMRAASSTSTMTMFGFVSACATTPTRAKQAARHQRIMRSARRRYRR